jgi:hypothetical protein
LLGIFLVVEDYSRVSLATWTPNQPLTSSITRLAILVPDISTSFDVAIQLADSSGVFVATIHGNLSTTTTLEVMAMGGDNHLVALETLNSIEKEFH